MVFGDNIDLRDAGKEEWLRGLWVTEESYEMSIEVSKYHGKLEMYEFVPDFPHGRDNGCRYFRRNDGERGSRII